MPRSCSTQTILAGLVREIAAAEETRDCDAEHLEQHGLPANRYARTEAMVSVLADRNV